jgi:hypothetical protein
MIGLGHQHLDVLADDFVRGETEQPLARRIVGADSTAPIDDDDAVNGRCYQGIKQVQRITLP